MGHTLPVRRFQPFRNLDVQSNGFVDRNRPHRDALRQGLALDQLHHENLPAVPLLEPVKGGNGTCQQL